MKMSDEWGDLKCLYKACQAAITDGGLFTDTVINERDESEWHNVNESESQVLGQGFVLGLALASRTSHWQVSKAIEAYNQLSKNNSTNNVPEYGFDLLTWRTHLIFKSGVFVIIHHF